MHFPQCFGADRSVGTLVGQAGGTLMPVSWRRHLPVLPMVVLAGVGCADIAAANPTNESARVPSLSFYGLPGHIEMPSAESSPDGEVSITASFFGGMQRTTLAFQVLPRLTGALRYSVHDRPATVINRSYDRSLDLHFRILDETRQRPAVAIGVRDFGGTGFTPRNTWLRPRTYLQP